MIKSILTLVLFCFVMMIVGALSSCFPERRLAKKKAKEDAAKYVTCMVIAKQWASDNCWIWLSCNGKNEKINDCTLIESVNKMDLIQLEKK